jgi:hypothetical protein
MGGRRTWPIQLGTSRAGAYGRCVCVGCNATPPKEKSRKGSKFPQLGGSGMLELHSGMLELQVEKGLKKKIVFEVDLRKERGSNVFVTPPPNQTTPPPTRSCRFHPWGKLWEKLLCFIFIKMVHLSGDIFHLHSVAPGTILYVLIYILKFEFFSCFI